MVNEAALFQAGLSSDNSQITLYLRQWISHGDLQSRDEAYTLIYNQLREIASRLLTREQGVNRLQAEELVSELFLRLNPQTLPLLNNRQHFYAICALSMRRILIDQARKARSQRCGKNIILVSIHDSIPLRSSKLIDVLVFEEVLNRLGKIDPQKLRLVELRVYLGLTLEEIAEVLGISLSKVNVDWRFTKHWLGRELS